MVSAGLSYFCRTRSAENWSAPKGENGIDLQPVRMPDGCNDDIFSLSLPPEYIRTFDLMGRCSEDDSTSNIVANRRIYLRNRAFDLLDCPQNVGTFQLDIISVSVCVVQNQIVTPFWPVPIRRENISIHFELADVLAVWVFGNMGAVIFRRCEQPICAAAPGRIAVYVCHRYSPASSSSINCSALPLMIWEAPSINEFSIKVKPSSQLKASSIQPSWTW